MAKRVRWTGTIRNQVDVMSKADLLRIRPLESRVLGNLARTVRGEAVGKVPGNGQLAGRLLHRDTPGSPDLPGGESQRGN